MSLRQIFSWLKFSKDPEPLETSAAAKRFADNFSPNPNGTWSLRYNYKEQETLHHVKLLKQMGLTQFPSEDIPLIDEKMKAAGFSRENTSVSLACFGESRTQCFFKGVDSFCAENGDDVDHLYNLFYDKKCDPTNYYNDVFPWVMYGGVALIGLMCCTGLIRDIRNARQRTQLRSENANTHTTENPNAPLLSASESKNESDPKSEPDSSSSTSIKIGLS